MIDIIRAIRKMPLDHLDKNSQRRIISKSWKYFGMHLTSSNLAMTKSWEDVCQEKRG
jgi:hypothetical protein